MPDYSKVQFIAWEIYTGAVYGPSGADYYAGLAPAAGDRRFHVLSQCLDIMARVEFTRRAIETAYENAQADSETLKIFVAPEFLYRGAAGAYLYDLLNGWEKAPGSFDPLPAYFKGPWSGLFGELRALVAEERFQDWVFVFGSAVGASFPRSSVVPDDPRFSAATGCNIALIQCGGNTPQQRDACYFTEKHLKSAIDFVNFTLRNATPRILTDQDIAHGCQPTWRILDRLIQEDPNGLGGSLFRFPHIRRSGGQILQFGLELCLDHCVGYVTAGGAPSPTGRLATGTTLVDIQLVPSCGMSLIPTSLALGPRSGPRNFSYAFNCDGLIPIGGSGHDRNTHIQLWNELESGEGYQVNEVAVIRRGYNEAGHIPVDAAAADLSALAPAEEIPRTLRINVKNILAGDLWRSHEPFRAGQNNHEQFWPHGPGFIRALDPQPLTEASDSLVSSANGAGPSLPQHEHPATALKALTSGREKS